MQKVGGYLAEVNLKNKSKGINNMAIKKQQKEYADVISLLTDMSAKDYRDAIRISRQYRKAGKMLEKTLARQEKQFMLPNKSKGAESATGLKYELA